MSANRSIDRSLPDFPSTALVTNFRTRFSYFYVSTFQDRYLNQFLYRFQFIPVVPKNISSYFYLF